MLSCVFQDMNGESRLLMPKTLVRVAYGSGYWLEIEALFGLSLRTKNGLVDLSDQRKQRTVND